MMHYPLTIEQFQYPQFADENGREFITAYINAVNVYYEEGKKKKNSGMYFTVDMVKGLYERLSNTKIESEEDMMFFEIFTEDANKAWQSGVRASGEVLDVPTDAVKIYPCFAEHSPRAEKMEQKEQYFRETGVLQSQIVLDSQGNLIDGYTSYLLAKAHSIQSVPVRYGRRQIVRASHKPGGKLYTWELPGILIDRVFVGDKVLVHSQRGIKAIRAAQHGKG